MPGGEQSNVNGNNINGNNVTVNNQPDTIEKLLDILAMKEASLAKAQEHIDKLLGIIGNITQKGNSND